MLYREHHYASCKEWADSAVLGNRFSPLSVQWMCGLLPGAHGHYFFWTTFVGLLLSQIYAIVYRNYCNRTKISFELTLQIGYKFGSIEPNIMCLRNTCMFVSSSNTKTTETYFEQIPNMLQTCILVHINARDLTLKINSKLYKRLLHLF